MNAFQAGQLKTHKRNWRKITSDPYILSIIQGTTIEFNSIPQYKPKPWRYENWDEIEKESIREEIQQLLEKRVIIPSEHENGEFVSGIFPIEKKDKSFRMILNLKDLNETVQYKKFKMESFKSALRLVTQHCWMASVDLVSAYYSVPVARKHWKFLKFKWEGQLYSYTCLAMGLSEAPRKFTKICKPIFSYLHNLGHVSSNYLDDSLLVGNSIDECSSNIDDTVHLFDTLGFVVHPEKSVLTPTQRITYLGFEIDSAQMTVSLTVERQEKILSSCKSLYISQKGSIRKVAGLIGLLVSSFPAVPLGPLHYRYLDNDKKRALKENCGDWEKVMVLSNESLGEIKWWQENIKQVFSPIIRPDPNIVIYSDASLKAWGAVCNGIRANGAWSPQEAKCHINVLEMKACYLALQSFLKTGNVHVRIYLDNTSAMNCLNKMGSSKSDPLNVLTKEIWAWCSKRNIWLSAGRIAGKDNVEADEESRKLNEDTEWKLNPSLLKESMLFLDIQPSIDLFASRLNFQLNKYVSFQPDPGAISIDAFTLNWHKFIFYAFPPFSLLTRVIQKVINDRADGVIVAPYWPTQSFFPLLMNILVKRPVLLSARTNLLNLPSNPNLQHPLHKKLKVLICRVSGKPILVKAFQQALPMFSWPHGDQRHRKHTLTSLVNGRGSLLRKKWIQFHRK